MHEFLEKNPKKISDMFNEIAIGYDLINNLSTFGLVHYWRKKLVKTLDPKRNETILDVAAGTGTSSNVLAKKSAKVTALDISENMLEEAKNKYPNIKCVQGDALDIPFKDNSFDKTTISFGIRNIQNPEKALREMCRVTKLGGKIVICEFTVPPRKIVRIFHKIYMSTVIKGFAALVTRNFEAYEYLSDSIYKWYRQEDLLKIMRKAGWEKTSYKNLNLGIVALHVGYKNKIN